jgi:outer membrane protein assembly factor BamB
VDGNVYSVDARTGALRWRFRTGGLVISSPAVGGGTIYVGSTDHRVYALAA